MAMSTGRAFSSPRSSRSLVPRTSNTVSRTFLSWTEAFHSCGQSKKRSALRRCIDRSTSDLHPPQVSSCSTNDLRRNFSISAAFMDDNKTLTSVDQFRNWKQIHRHAPIDCFSEVLGHAIPKETINLLHELEAAEVEHFAPASNCDIHIAVSVERYQRIFSNPTSEETEWYNFYEKILVEKSALMPDEIEADKKRKEDESSATAAGRNVADTQSDGASSSFVAASRETEADARNDHSTINRKLDETLYFIVKDDSPDGQGQKIGATWAMPSAVFNADTDETLRQTAERAVRRYLDSSTEIFFIGNFPVSCKTVPSPSGDRQTKVFFFRALLVSQDFELSEDTADGHAAWVTASELAEYDRDCADSLGKFIL